MQILKFIGAGVFALFTLASVVGALKTTVLVMRGAGNSYRMGNLFGGVFGVILWGVLSYVCWKSATKTPPTYDEILSPLPEIPQVKR